MTRLGLRGLLAGGFFALVLAGAAGATPPVPEPDEPADPSRLVPIPAGCPEPDEADVVFVGEVVDKDGYIERGTVRFELVQLRAGSPASFSVDGLIDVRYGPDSKYLDIGEEYLVSAAVESEVGRLSSTVAPESPRFGGNDVIGLDDTAEKCPEIEATIVTLHLDGTSVDSSVMSPMFEDGRVLLATIGVPAAIAALTLVALGILRAMWRWMVGGVFALGRAAVTPVPDQKAVRVRRHGGADASGGHQRR